MISRKSILIVGLGSLGRNYLKAISKLQINVNVYCYDKKKLREKKKLKIQKCKIYNNK